MGTTLTSKNIISKQSGETLSVSMDFSNWVDSEATISNPAIDSIVPSGLTVSNFSVNNTTKKVSMKLSGGTNGATYRVAISIDVDDGQILIGDGICKVRDR